MSNSAQYFRDIFQSILRENKYSKEKLDQAIFSVPDTLYNELNKKNTLQDIESILKTKTPESFYQDGTQRVTSNIDISALKNKQKLVTLIILPGILGEFIQSRPFETFFTTHKNSTFHTKYINKLKNIHDKVYSLEKLNYQSHPLSDVIDIASFDNSSGKSAINVLCLKPIFGSLETIGATFDNNSNITPLNTTKTYLNRLNILFNKVIEPQDRENIFIIGYSRGGPIALELIQQAIKLKTIWSKDLQGIITLGGVIHGTELADNMIYNSKSTEYYLLHSIKKLLDTLQTTNSTRENILDIFRWTKSIFSLKKLTKLLKAKKKRTGIQFEDIDIAPPNVSEIFTLLHKAITQFQLNRFQTIFTYRKNISRYKVLINSSYQSIIDLTTEKRLEWWKLQTLPKGIKLLAVSATMGSPTTSKNNRSLLLQFPFYGSHIPDYKFLRTSYYNLYELSQQCLNDTQTTMAKSQFWTNYLMNINPKQNKLEEHQLGVLGTHHWGLAFQAALETISNGVNPFPRTELLEAFGIYSSSTL